MVKFLIHRPIAVLITALAISILGIIMAYQLPVSLMPDIEIPEITVQINGKKQAAKELERSVVGPLRRELLQVPYLQDIESRARDGIGIIKLRFDYGASIDYAFLDVNEQIDAAMARLPREIERPNVIKASATDLPVFFLNVSYKSALDSLISEDRYLELSEFSEEIIRKRLEQLGEVALVDITGTQYPEIQIEPDLELLQNLGISENSLKQLLEEHNIDLGNLIVRDGKYQYNVRFSSFLRSARDIAELYLKVDDRVLQLKELAKVQLLPQRRAGAYFSNGKQAIGMAIIKQADARIADLEEEVKFLLEVFQKDYPELEFSLSQDQSKLLNYSIKNLGQSLLIGSMLAFVILFLFLQNARSPWLIGISIPFSLLLSLLLFYFLKISINIISLSGLILGIGLMIDNAIIVIDNISQQIARGLSLDEACVKGTNEVKRPLISSTLTTRAVFIPLIFLSGISGALFWDQARAVSIGLGSSLLV
ncbi:MAG: efflux RND transporter permease subunit, partial [Bacteroidota bacterium]